MAKLSDFNLPPLTREEPNYSWSNKFNYKATPQEAFGNEIDLSERIQSISISINEIELEKALAYDCDIKLDNEVELNHKSIELQELYSELQQQLRDEV
ncbi:hypothetical protein [Empedobacter falsenii]